MIERRVLRWLPHPAFLRGILLRGTGVWLGVRTFLLVVGLTVPALPTAAAIVAASAGLTTLDGRRYSETILLANLGIPEWRLFAIAAVPAAVCELLVGLVA